MNWIELQECVYISAFTKLDALQKSRLQITRKVSHPRDAFVNIGQCQVTGQTYTRFVSTLVALEVHIQVTQVLSGLTPTQLIAGRTKVIYVVHCVRRF